MFALTILKIVRDALKAGEIVIFFSRLNLLNLIVKILTGIIKWDTNC